MRRSWWTDWRNRESEIYAPLTSLNSERHPTLLNEFTEPIAIDWWLQAVSELSWLSMAYGQNYLPNVCFHQQNFIDLLNAVYHYLLDRSRLLIYRHQFIGTSSRSPFALFDHTPAIQIWRDHPKIFIGTFYWKTQVDLKNNETSWEHKPQENTEREPLKQSILRMENFKSHHTGKSCLSGDNGKSKKNQKIKRLRIEMSFDLNEKELSWRTGRAENKSKTQTRRHNRVEPDSGRRMYQRVCLKLLKWFPPIPALLIVWTSSSEDGSSDSIPSTAASFDYISALSLLNRFLLVLLNCFLLQPHLRLHRQPHHQTLFQQHLAVLDWQAHSRTDFQNGFPKRISKTDFQTDSKRIPNRLRTPNCTPHPVPA